MYTLKMWSARSSIATGGLEVDDNHFRFPETIITSLRERCLESKGSYKVEPRVVLQLTKEQVVQHAKLCEKFMYSYYAELHSLLTARDWLNFMAERYTCGEFKWDDYNKQLVIEFTLSEAVASEFLGLHDLT